MTESEWDLLESIAAPEKGKYLAQYSQEQLRLEFFNFQGTKIRSFSSIDSRTNQVTYHHLQAIDASEVLLLPIRKTLKQYSHLN